MQYTHIHLHASIYIFISISVVLLMLIESENLARSDLGHSIKPQGHCPGSGDRLATDLRRGPATDDPLFSITGEFTPV